jgi:hypothetical protein
MRISKAVLVFAASLILGVVTGADIHPAWAQKVPVDCSGRTSICYTYDRCSGYEGTWCTEWTTTWWYWYR